MGEVIGIVFLVLLGLGFVVLSIVMPIVAFVRSGRAREQAIVLRREVDALQRRLSELEHTRAVAVVAPAVAASVEVATPVVAVAEPVAVPAEQVAIPTEAAIPTETAASTPPVEEAVPAAMVAGAPTSAAAEPAPSESAARPASPSAASGAAQPSAAAEPATIPVAAAELAARMAEAAGPASPPPPQPPSGTPPSAPKPPEATSLEEKIALVWFTRIGAVALLLGAAFFFKVAVDNNWIGPWGRVALGAVLGIGALGIGELTRASTRPVWTQVITGVGLSLLLLSAYASFVFYHLVGFEAAFAAFFVISLLGGALAIHHKAEAILIFSLAAALSAPPLLSTNHDNPAGLFGYLLLVTSLSHFASLKMQFRWSMWLGIAGSGILFLGWYAAWFNIAPAPAHPYVDEPVKAGAYLEMSARTIPLGAVTAFLIQWVALWAIARRDKPRLWPVAVLVAAAVLAHVGYTLLLHDHPLILGVVLVALGLGATVILTRENKSHLLSIPLGASFLMFLFTTHQAHEQPLPMMLLLLLWASIYVVGFLRQPRPNVVPTAGTLALVGITGFLLAVSAATVLGKHHPLSFELLIVVLSLAYAVLAAMYSVAVMSTVAVGLSFLFVLATLPHGHDTTDFKFVGVAALWSSVYLGAIAWELVWKRRPATALRLVTFSGAGLAFVLLALAHISDGPEAGTLRAVLLAAVGLCDLLLGAALLRRPDHDARGAATVVLGQALGLFVAAVGTMWSGATVTVVWAVFAAVVVWLGGRERNAWWLAGGLTLFGLTLIHLVSVDVPEPAKQTALFISTGGKEGVLSVPFLFNQCSLGLLGCGIAFFVGGRGARRAGTSGFSISGSVLQSLGHWMLLALTVTEVHRLVQRIPTPPTGRVDNAEFSAFLSLYAQAQVHQRQELAMWTTLVFGLYAATLLGVGFGIKDRLHRYLGLGLFSLTLLKLGLWDVWKLERIFQVMVLLGVGGLLLGSGFLYARFGKRLLAVLRDGAVKAGVVLLALWGGGAFGFPKADLAEMRSVDGVAGPGFYRVEVDADLYRRTRDDGSPLGDLRLAGPDGNEVGYLIRDVPVEAQATVPTNMVDPVTLKDGSVQAVFDLGLSGLRHSRVSLSIDGDSYFRRTRVESSQDEKTWGKLTEGSWVYRVVTVGGTSSETTISYPVSDARYLRVTVLAGPETVRRITGGQVAFAPPASLPVLRSLPLKVTERSKDEPGKRSLYAFDLGSPGLPIEALDLTITGAAFERMAWVSGTNFLGYWAPFGGGWLHRTVGGTQSGGARENTRLTFSPNRKRYLRVEIHDRDDAALVVESGVALYRAQELVFRAETAGSYQLYVGSTKLGTPSYELAQVMARAKEVQVLPATLGPLAANPDFGKHAEAPTPFTERHKLLFGLGLGGVLVLLALWAFSLLRKAKPADS